MEPDRKKLIVTTLALWVSKNHINIFNPVDVLQEFNNENGDFTPEEITWASENATVTLDLINDKEELLATLMECYAGYQTMRGDVDDNILDDYSQKLDKIIKGIR